LLESYYETNVRYIDYDRIASFIVETNSMTKKIDQGASNIAHETESYNHSKLVKFFNFRLRVIH
jgi:hypothetical protein